MIATVLIVILVLALLGVLPRWNHSRSWGYYPTGGLGMVLLIVVVLLLMGGSDRHHKHKSVFRCSRSIGRTGAV